MDRDFGAVGGGGGNRPGADVPVVGDAAGGVAARDAGREDDVEFVEADALGGRERAAERPLVGRGGLVAADVGQGVAVAVAVLRAEVADEVVRDARDGRRRVDGGRAGAERVVAVRRVGEERIGVDVADARRRGRDDVRREAGRGDVLDVAHRLRGRAEAVAVEDVVARDGRVLVEVEARARRGGAAVPREGAELDEAAGLVDARAAGRDLVALDEAVAHGAARHVDAATQLRVGGVADAIRADDAALDGAARHVDALTRVGCALAAAVGDEAVADGAARHVDVAAVGGDVVGDGRMGERAARHVDAAAAGGAAVVAAVGGVAVDLAVRDETAVEADGAAVVAAGALAHDAVGDGAERDAERPAAAVAVGIAVPVAVLHRETMDERAGVADVEDAAVGGRAGSGVENRGGGAVLALHLDVLYNARPDRPGGDLVGAVRDDHRAAVVVRRPDGVDRLLEGVRRRRARRVGIGGRRASGDVGRGGPHVDEVRDGEGGRLPAGGDRQRDGVEAERDVGPGRRGIGRVDRAVGVEVPGVGDVALRAGDDGGEGGRTRVLEERGARREGDGEGGAGGAGELKGADVVGRALRAGRAGEVVHDGGDRLARVDGGGAGEEGVVAVGGVNVERVVHEVVRGRSTGFVEAGGGAVAVAVGEDVLHRPARLVDARPAGGVQAGAVAVDGAVQERAGRDVGARADGVAGMARDHAVADGAAGDLDANAGSFVIAAVAGNEALFDDAALGLHAAAGDGFVVQGVADDPAARDQRGVLVVVGADVHAAARAVAAVVGDEAVAERAAAVHRDAAAVALRVGGTREEVVRDDAVLNEAAEHLHCAPVARAGATADDAVRHRAGVEDQRGRRRAGLVVGAAGASVREREVLEARVLLRKREEVGRGGGGLRADDDVAGVVAVACEGQRRRNRHAVGREAVLAGADADEAALRHGRDGLLDGREGRLGRGAVVAVVAVLGDVEDAAEVGREGDGAGDGESDGGFRVRDGGGDVARPAVEGGAVNGRRRHGDGLANGGPRLGSGDGPAGGGGRGDAVFNAPLPFQLLPEARARDGGGGTGAAVRECARERRGVNIVQLPARADDAFGLGEIDRRGRRGAGKRHVRREGGESVGGGERGLGGAEGLGRTGDLELPGVGRSVDRHAEARRVGGIGIAPGEGVVRGDARAIGGEVALQDHVLVDALRRPEDERRGDRRVREVRGRFVEDVHREGARPCVASVVAEEVRGRGLALERRGRVAADGDEEVDLHVRVRDAGVEGTAGAIVVEDRMIALEDDVAADAVAADDVV